MYNDDISFLILGAPSTRRIQSDFVGSVGMIPASYIIASKKWIFEIAGPMKIVSISFLQRRVALIDLKELRRDS